MAFDSLESTRFCNCNPFPKREDDSCVDACRCIHRKLKSLMLDQEMRYAHWSPLLSTRTRHFLPEGAKCFSLESLAEGVTIFPVRYRRSRRMARLPGIIVINPLRCVKLLLSTLSCVSDRISWQFLTEGVSVFHKKDHYQWIMIFSAGQWNDTRRILGRDNLRDDLRVWKGSGRVTFATNHRSSPSSRRFSANRSDTFEKYSSPRFLKCVTSEIRFPCSSLTLISPY